MSTPRAAAEALLRLEERGENDAPWPNDVLVGMAGALIEAEDEVKDLEERLRNAHATYEHTIEYLRAELDESRSTHRHVDPDKCVICQRCREALRLL